MNRSNEVEHILGHCMCDDEDMTCWYWRTAEELSKNDDSGDVHELQNRQNFAIQAIIAKKELEARLDEIGNVQLEYGHYIGQTYVNGQAMTVEERHKDLEAELETLKKGEA